MVVQGIQHELSLARTALSMACLCQHSPTSLGPTNLVIYKPMRHGEENALGQLGVGMKI